MKKASFIRTSALAMALAIACTTLPMNALAATDMSVYSTADFESTYPAWCHGCRPACWRFGFQKEKINSYEQQKADPQT